MAITLLILGLALGTLAFRLVPLAFLTRITMPEWAQDWLSLVPGTVLAASLAQALLVQDSNIIFSWGNIQLLAAVPTFLVAWRTRSVLLTMLCGMICYALAMRLWG